MHLAASPPFARPSATTALGRCLLDLGQALGSALAAESDRWFLWLPVAVAAGILLHLAAPGPLSVPAVALVAVVGTAAGSAALLVRRSRPLLALTLAGLAGLAAGILLLALRLALVEAPVLPRAGVWTVEGRIAELEPRPPGVRLLLDRLSIEGLAPEATPERVLLTVRHGAERIEVGERLRLRAFLQPPRGPVVPGGFDHARHAWFEGVGAIGWALGRPTLLDTPPSAGFALALARLRARLAERFAEPLPGPTGAVAAALVTGLRAGIDDATWQDFQRSGLAHLLAISGLHMSLVAGTVLLAGRWLLALVPPIAERLPARKPAAVLALLATAFYLAISGATVPTQRAFAMVALALLAILADRDPFSMRLLAWAALVVLVARPEAVAGPSFQLSFAAVLALIAVWERFGAQLGEPAPGGLARLARYPMGVAATTLVASLATTPLTAFHFQTVAGWAVVSNLLAVPLTSFWIMPAGLSALLLVPFGLEEPAVRAMGAGIELLLAIAHGAARLPGAAIAVPLWPASALAWLWAGGLWLALWRRPWRRLGLFALVPAALLIARDRPADVVVTPWLAQVAVATPTGARVLAFERDEPVEEALARALGGRAPEGAGADLRCDRGGCVLERNGTRLTLARRLEALLEACREPGLVVARLGPERCPAGPAELVGPRALLESGGLALRLEPDGTIRRRTVVETRGAWPWVRREPSRKSDGR
jgi:competence protein ComEC